MPFELKMTLNPENHYFEHPDAPYTPDPNLSDEENEEKEKKQNFQ